MQKASLMDRITPESLQKMIPCFKPLIKRYGKGETILSYEDGAPTHVAVLLKGSARLELITSEGDAFLLEQYREGDVFGELFTLPSLSETYTVTAQETSQVVLIDYQHIITPCERICPHHTQLISNLFIMTAQRTQELSLHLSFLHQKNTREKLLCYLRFARSQAKAAGSEVFQIPFTLSQLASYLCVDRSAMSRELKALGEEGLIFANRNRFRLFG
ncbi:MAG: Crp/Fnr family transcriptional regulator [Lachnospiraceae bacterium]|nr:Crp/Fnr family transcriptional regulator [Lachnospiraceae bacterium]